MLVSRLLVACFAIEASAHAGHRRRAQPPALNPQLTNTLDSHGAGVLYYNGSGDVPAYNMTSPVPAPITPYNTSAIEMDILNEIVAIVSGKTGFADNCTQCLAATEVMHITAISQPVETVTKLLIAMCNKYQFSINAATCESEFAAPGGIGPYWTQLFAKMSLATGDYQAWCFYQWKVCKRPQPIEIDESKYFCPKPKSAEVVPVPSHETIDVLHLSDFHIDPRYDIGSEANCTSYLCCRPYSVNKELHTGSKNASLPASRFGSLFCDTPADLGLSTFNTMPQFFEKEDISFAIYTGDIVSHDGADQLSRAYVEYSEAETYRIFKSAMGNVPIFPTLGNHDSLPEAFNTPNSMNPPSGNLFSWNYEMVSSLWAKDGWITPDEAKYASTHYGAYAHTTREGLRVISLNSDFWYTRSIYSYINFTNPDQSGILEFLADELTKCEQKGQRAWVISHVLTGYDGTQSLPNPSGLFHSIVRRFSPTTIAGVFFGHTHEDQIQLYYDFKPSSLRNGTLRNTTNVDYTKPLMVGYIGPSVTPLTGNNAGYQRLQVDRKTFSIMGTQTYFANMTNSLAWSTPIWELEYDTRKEYTYHSSWPKNAPLNATFWHRVTEQMLQNQTLVERYNLLETKSAVGTKNCSTKACAQQKVCYIRSGNAATGLACGGANGPS